MQYLTLACRSSYTHCRLALNFPSLHCLFNCVDTHMTTIDILKAEVARLERQRQMDQQQYTVFTGARLLSRVVRARQKMALRRRWEAWQVGGYPILTSLYHPSFLLLLFTLT